MPKEIKKSLQRVRELSKKAFYVLKDIWAIPEMFWAGSQCRPEVQNAFVSSVLGLLCGAYVLEKSGFKILENTVQKYNYDCFLKHYSFLQ